MEGVTDLLSAAAENFRRGHTVFWIALKKIFEGGAHTRQGREKFGIRTLMVLVIIASHRKKCILCHFFPFVGIPPLNVSQGTQP